MKIMSIILIAIHYLSIVMDQFSCKYKIIFLEMLFNLYNLISILEYVTKIR